MKRYIELKENAAATHIKIEIWYRLEGSKTRPRGYYLTVTPVTRENRSGYMLESFDAFSGYTQLVQPVTRKSAKAEAAAEATAADIIDILVSRVCNKNGLEVKTA
jgi:hypothetical protein